MLKMAVYILPRFTQGRYFPFEPTKSYREDPKSNPGNTVDLEILKKFEPKKTNLEIKKGSTLFMQGNCIHGSYPNHSNRSRPLLSISYIPKGTKFIRGKNANRMEISLN